MLIKFHLGDFCLHFDNFFVTLQREKGQTPYPHV